MGVSRSCSVSWGVVRTLLKKFKGAGWGGWGQTEQPKVCWRTWKPLQHKESVKTSGWQTVIHMYWSWEFEKGENRIGTWFKSPGHNPDNARKNLKESCPACELIRKSVRQSRLHLRRTNVTCSWVLWQAVALAGPMRFIYDLWKRIEQLETQGASPEVLVRNCYQQVWHQIGRKVCSKVF